MSCRHRWRNVTSTLHVISSTAGQRCTDSCCDLDSGHVVEKHVIRLSFCGARKKKTLPTRRPSLDGYWSIKFRGSLWGPIFFGLNGVNQAYLCSGADRFSGNFLLICLLSDILTYAVVLILGTFLGNYAPIPALTDFLFREAVCDELHGDTCGKTLLIFGRFLADRTNGRAYATLLRLSSSVCLSSVVVTLCIVAKRCVLKQKLLLRAYRKSYMRNRLVPK